MSSPEFRTITAAVCALIFAAIVAVVAIAEWENADEYTEGEVDIAEDGFDACSLLTPAQIRSLGLDAKASVPRPGDDALCMWVKGPPTERGALAVVLHPSLTVDYCVDQREVDPESISLNGYPALVGGENACISPAPDQMIEIAMSGTTAGMAPARDVAEAIASSLAERA